MNSLRDRTDKNVSKAGPFIASWPGGGVALDSDEPGTCSFGKWLAWDLQCVNGVELLAIQVYRQLRTDIADVVASAVVLSAMLRSLLCCSLCDIAMLRCCNICDLNASFISLCV